jgi:hypothetical protein
LCPPPPPPPSSPPSPPPHHRYLRKLTANANGDLANPPPLPPHIANQKSYETGSSKNAEEFSVEDDGAPDSSSKTEEVKNFALSSVDAFDELVANGVAVEITTAAAVASTTPITQETVVSLSVSAYKWEPSSGVARAFASTDNDPNEGRLTFVVGKGHVTEALDVGVRRLCPGDTGVIVGNSSYGYGEIGLPGLVNSKSYV